MEKELADAKRKKSEAKPAHIQALQIKRKLGPRRRYLEALRTKAEDARRVFQELEREVHGVAIEVETLEKDLSDMHRRASDDVMRVTDETISDQVLKMLPATVSTDPSRAGDLEVLRQCLQKLSKTDEDAPARREPIAMEDGREGQYSACSNGGAIVPTNEMDAFVCQEVRNMDDLVELERQSAEAQRTAACAEERVREAKRIKTVGNSTRVKPY